MIVYLVSDPDTDEDAAWLGQFGKLMTTSGEAEARGLNLVLLENEWEGLGDGTGRWVTSYRLERGGCGG